MLCVPVLDTLIGRFGRGDLYHGCCHLCATAFCAVVVVDVIVNGN